MDLNAIYTWLLLTAVLLIIEALTAGLTTIWFAGGALAALILTFLGAPFWLQTGVFVLAAGLILGALGALLPLSRFLDV